jgi:hypothetical protein
VSSFHDPDDDIVTRLRALSHQWFECCEDIHQPLLEAADEIDRLRRWKYEACIVLGNWEQTWEAAGKPGPLGSYMPSAVADEIIRLRGLLGAHYRRARRIRR